jgi:hypothetical protein
MATIGNISVKTFHYWKQMSSIGNLESGRAWQVNKVLALSDRKEFVQKIKYRGATKVGHRGGIKSIVK